jgi:hypothetical protein
LIDGVLQKLATQNDLRRVEAFIKAHPDLGLTAPSFQSAIEIITTNIQWLKTNINSLNEWLKNNQN